ncbi:MAG: hypothetical protein ACE1Y4_01355, partial [Lysobacterales bacterium]
PVSSNMMIATTKPAKMVPLTLFSGFIFVFSDRIISLLSPDFLIRGRCAAHYRAWLPGLQGLIDAFLLLRRTRRYI